MHSWHFDAGPNRPLVEVGASLLVSQPDGREPASLRLPASRGVRLLSSLGAKYMRRIGYVLLVVGFVWIACQQVSGFMRFGLRPVIEQQWSKLSPEPDEEYSLQEVQDIVRDTAVDAYNRFPFVIAPGLVMLIGGILLGCARCSPDKSRGQ